MKLVKEKTDTLVLEILENARGIAADQHFKTTQYGGSESVESDARNLADL